MWSHAGLGGDEVTHLSGTSAPSLPGRRQRCGSRCPILSTDAPPLGPHTVCTPKPTPSPLSSLLPTPGSFEGLWPLSDSMTLSRVETGHRGGQGDWVGPWDSSGQCGPQAGLEGGSGEPSLQGLLGPRGSSAAPCLPHPHRGPGTGTTGCGTHREGGKALTGGRGGLRPAGHLSPLERYRVPAWSLELDSLTQALCPASLLSGL